MIYKLKSYAKVNLFLHIIGKRADDYHDLESLFYFPNIFDEILIADNNEFGKSFTLEGEFGEFLKNYDFNQNLIFKSYRAILKKHQDKIPTNLQFKIIKNLPVSAGIGGGSSNAASILSFLNKNYKLEETCEELVKIAAKLGADIPASLDFKSCFVSGIGEKVKIIKNFPRLNILLVNPKIQISTQKIFEIGFNKNQSSILKDINQYNFDNKNELFELLCNTSNTLYPNTLSICPEIRDIINNIEVQDGCIISRMSGSGATCFGIFDKVEELNSAEKNIKKLMPEFWVKSCSI